MSTIEVTPTLPELLRATGFPKPDRYRFYACELKWNSWHCKQQADNSLWEKSPDTLLTSIITVEKWVPPALDRLIISSKLHKPVILKD